MTFFLRTLVHILKENDDKFINCGSIFRITVIKTGNNFKLCFLKLSCCNETFRVTGIE